MQTVTENTQDPADQPTTSKRRWRSERGAGIVECALCLALVAMVAAAGSGKIGDAVSNQVNDVSAELGEPCANYDDRWQAHQDVRDEHKANGTWSGSANRTTRQDWKAMRDALKALGC